MKISYSTDTNHIPISEFNRKQSEVEKLSISCILKNIESCKKVTAILWMRGGYFFLIDFSQRKSSNINHHKKFIILLTIYITSDIV